MRNPAKDATTAFGAIMTMLIVWSFLSASKSKQKSDSQIKALHSKLDLIIKSIKTA